MSVGRSPPQAVASYDATAISPAALRLQDWASGRTLTVRLPAGKIGEIEVPLT